MGNPHQTPQIATANDELSITNYFHFPITKRTVDLLARFLQKKYFFVNPPIRPP